MNTDTDLGNLRDWIGRKETYADFAGPMPVAALNATIDRDAPFPGKGDAVPPLYHWCYCAFLGLVPTAELGADGHPARGGFLPPVTLPRRMWAGSDVAFPGDIRIGDEIARTATVEDVVEKTGRSGQLVFVTVRHEVSTPRGPAVTDRQTIVYREAPDVSAPDAPAAPRGTPAPADAAFSRTVTPDIAMLFRYSALIFNAHRIHYDVPFTTGPVREGGEGYPGLVVHGPLIATLMADLARREHPDTRIARFNFRAVKPAFDGRTLTLAGKPAGDGLTLWAADDTGDLCAEAAVELA